MRARAKKATEERNARSEFLRSPKTKFLADESIEAGAVRVLPRFLRYNIRTVAEIGLSGHSDHDVIAYAYKLRRVLLTHDRDFLDDSHFHLHTCHGVIYWSPDSDNLRRTLSYLWRPLRLFGRGAELWSHTKIIIGSDGVITKRTWEREEGRVHTSRYKWGAGRVERMD